MGKKMTLRPAEDEKISTVSLKTVKALFSAMMAHVNEIDPETALAIWTGDKSFSPVFYAVKYGKLVAAVEMIQEHLDLGTKVEDVIASLGSVSPSTGMEKCAGNNAKLAGIGRG